MSSERYKNTTLNERQETMAVRIRLRRVGRKKMPMYRIIVAESTSPRDGRFIENIGQYNPRANEGGLNIDAARANHWLDMGALPTDTVRSLLRRAGVLKQRHETRLAKKRQGGAVPVGEGGAPESA
jgi:small subunit ribosomal protein S16